MLDEPVCYELEAWDGETDNICTRFPVAPTVTNSGGIVTMCLAGLRLKPLGQHYIVSVIIILESVGCYT